MKNIISLERFKIEKHGLLKCAQDIYARTGRTYPVKLYVREQTGCSIKHAIDYVHSNIHNPWAG